MYGRAYLPSRVLNRALYKVIILPCGCPVVAYCLLVSFNWEVRDAYGALLGSKGKGKVEELTQEDDTPQVSIEVSTTFHGVQPKKGSIAIHPKKGQ